MAAVISLLAGLVGVVLGAGLSWAVTRRERRVATTFAMHQEFNGLEMSRVRYAASELLSKYPDKTYVELRTLLGREQMRDVWAVSRFYQRLWLGISLGGVHKKYVPELFGDLFMWWYDNSYERQLLPLPTEPAFHMRALKQWLDRNTTPEQRARWEVGNQLFPMGAAPDQPG